MATTKSRKARSKTKPRNRKPVSPWRALKARHEREEHAVLQAALMTCKWSLRRTAALLACPYSTIQRATRRHPTLRKSVEMHAAAKRKVRAKKGRRK